MITRHLHNRGLPLALLAQLGNHVILIFHGSGIVFGALDISAWILVPACVLDGRHEGCHGLWPDVCHSLFQGRFVGKGVEERLRGFIR